MKKLLLLFATLLISLNSMALSFPRSAYGQQRILNKVTSKTATLSETLSLKASLMKTASVNIEEETSHQSFVEMFANYIVRLFTERIFQSKNETVVNTFEKEEAECFAIKQDFEYQFIG